MYARAIVIGTEGEKRRRKDCKEEEEKRLMNPSRSIERIKEKKKETPRRATRERFDEERTKEKANRKEDPSLLLQVRTTGGEV